MLSVGTQRTLARVSSASATQTLAWAAATISGRASASRNAVARLIGNRRSVGAVGAGRSVRPTASGFGLPDVRGESGGDGAVGAVEAGGSSPAPPPRRG